MKICRRRFYSYTCRHNDHRHAVLIVYAYNLLFSVGRLFGKHHLSDPKLLMNVILTSSRKRIIHCNNIVIICIVRSIIIREQKSGIYLESFSNLIYLFAFEVNSILFIFSNSGTLDTDHASEIFSS